MKRASDNLLLTMLIVLALAGCAGQPAAKTSSEPAPAESKRVTVAVLEFEDHSIGSGAQGLGRTLADRISEELAGRLDLRLIDRESIQKILEELSFSNRELANPEGQLKLGNLLGARYLIVGGYTTFGPLLRIDGRIVEVEKGLAEGSSLEGKVADRSLAEQAFSKLITDQLSSKILPPKGSGRAFFMQGIAFEKSNNNTEALEMYQKALAVDPQNQEAKERMETLLLKELR